SLPVVRAMRTITFFRLKSGHLLNEGAKFCGELVLARIGIAESALDRVAPPAARMEITRPAVWINHLPRLADDTHKYARGHAVVLSGPAHATGAARLAAHAALRSGAGVVSVAARPSAVLVNASHLTEIMVKRIASSDEIQAVFAEPRVRALVLGPGAGVTPETRDAIDRALATQGSVILDADALTCLANDPDLRARMRRRRAPGATVLTPHAGEFRRLYPDGDPGSLDTLRRCAADDNAVLVAKGPRTLIVAPDGRVAVSIDAPPTLATAGSGDVLAGIIAGLTAQGMPGFEASMAAVWLHARAAHHVGLGLIASDLPHALPAVFQELAIVAGRAVEAGASATQSS
ncbi:MAG: NAD(P)H-hydrate dehydratase, partial [Pseudomonadota bacterium]